VADQVLPRGKKKKLGTVGLHRRCKTCSDIGHVYAQFASRSDWTTSTKRRRHSLTGLHRRVPRGPHAGVEVLVVGLDSNSLTRLASSCARQGYRPIYNTFVSIALERFKDDPEPRRFR